MKRLFITLLMTMAAPSQAVHKVRTDAHAWYNPEGDIEISSRMVPPRTMPLPLPHWSATDTLPVAQLFLPNSTQLMAPSDSLEALGKRLQQTTETKTVVITGYTDSTGRADYNFQLSMRRAQRIMHYLAGYAPRHRYRANGLGEAHPKASNATRSGREQNRRVTVTVQ